MANLMNTALIWVLFFITGFSQIPLSDQSPEANRYCSSDYHFCAKYPASILTFAAPLVQGNGIILKSEDGFAEVIMAAFPLLANTNSKAIFFSSVREKSMTENEPKVISSIFGEDFYECYFMVGRYYYYHQCFLFDDYFVRVEIRAPINMPDKLQILKQQINLEFNTPKEGEKATSSLEIRGIGG